MKLLSPQHRSGRNDQGYILITLILFVALLAIALTATLPVVKQQVKRDREEEMIHRGVQYSRAIKKYVKKFGSYPTKIEDLQSASNTRFLRKRYKDPITGKDFKLLHMGEVQTGMGSSIAGATSVANMAAGQQSNGGFGGSSFGGGGFGNNNSFGNNSSFGNSGGNGGFGNSTFGNSNSGFGNNSGFGGNNFGSNNSGFGGGNTFGGNNNSFGGFGGNNQPSAQQPSGTDTSQANGQAPGEQDQQGVPGLPQGFGQQPGQQNQSGNQTGNQVFGGGPIVGVVSVSKEKSIRVFNKKDHYDKWYFIYDMTSDNGALITTPYQGLQTAQGGLQQGIPGQQQSGMPNSPFGGQGSAFGGQGSALGGQGSAFGGQGSGFGFQGGQMPGGMQPSQPGNNQPQFPGSGFPPEQSPQ